MQAPFFIPFSIFFVNNEKILPQRISRSLVSRVN